MLHLPHLLCPHQHHFLRHLPDLGLRLLLPRGRLLELGSGVREHDQRCCSDQGNSSHCCMLSLPPFFTFLFGVLFLSHLCDPCDEMRNQSADKDCGLLSIQAGGAFAFVTSLGGWWILLAIMLASIDFPLSLPVGDLSTYIKGASERKSAV